MGLFLASIGSPYQAGHESWPCCFSDWIGLQQVQLSEIWCGDSRGILCSTGKGGVNGIVCTEPLVLWDELHLLFHPFVFKDLFFLWCWLHNYSPAARSSQFTVHLHPWCCNFQDSGFSRWALFQASCRDWSTQVFRDNQEPPPGYATAYWHLCYVYQVHS